MEIILLHSSSNLPWSEFKFIQIYIANWSAYFFKLQNYSERCKTPGLDYLHIQKLYRNIVVRMHYSVSVSIYTRTYMPFVWRGEALVCLVSVSVSMCAAVVATATIAITPLCTSSRNEKKKISGKSNYMKTIALCLWHRAPTWWAPDTQTNVGCNCQYRQASSAHIEFWLQRSATQCEYYACVWQRHRRPATHHTSGAMTIACSRARSAQWMACLGRSAFDWISIRSDGAVTDACVTVHSQQWILALLESHTNGTPCDVRVHRSYIHPLAFTSAKCDATMNECISYWYFALCADLALTPLALQLHSAMRACMLACSMYWHAMQVLDART